jgi:hypothetical protein
VKNRNAVSILEIQQQHWAFVSFDRTSQNAEGKITKIREYRTLLHSKGQWKILAVQAYVDYPSGK